MVSTLPECGIVLSAAWGRDLAVFREGGDMAANVGAQGYQRNQRRGVHRPHLAYATRALWNFLCVSGSVPGASCNWLNSP